MGRQKILFCRGNVVLCDVNEQVLTEKVAKINAKEGGHAIGVVDVMANFAGGYLLKERVEK